MRPAGAGDRAVLQIFDAPAEEDEASRSWRQPELAPADALPRSSAGAASATTETPEGDEALPRSSAGAASGPKKFNKIPQLAKPAQQAPVDTWLGAAAQPASSPASCPSSPVQPASPLREAPSYGICSTPGCARKAVSDVEDPLQVDKAWCCRSCFKSGGKEHGSECDREHQAAVAAIAPPAQPPPQGGPRATITTAPRTALQPKAEPKAPAALVPPLPKPEPTPAGLSSVAQATEERFQLRLAPAPAGASSGWRTSDGRMVPQDHIDGFWTGVFKERLEGDDSDGDDRVLGPKPRSQRLEGDDSDGDDRVFFSWAAQAAAQKEKAAAAQEAAAQEAPAEASTEMWRSSVPLWPPPLPTVREVLDWNDQHVPINWNTVEGDV